jgi:hypothetical protein
MPRLKAFVHVAGTVYGPDDDVPPEVAVRITNPNAWEGGVPPSFDDEDDGSPGASGAAAVEPPRSGPGSGKDAWAAYAAARGLEVPADADRAAIIAAVDKAK